MKKTTTTFYCDVCGKEMLVPYIEYPNLHGSHYCSEACMGKSCSVPKKNTGICYCDTKAKVSA